MEFVRSRFSFLTKSGYATVSLGFLALLCFAQTRAPSRAHSTATSAAKVKAIWEPVNYPEDVPLTDVFFVNADVGWASGGTTAGGVIISTQDGGDHWTAQWGDPHGADTKALGFFFLDASHGWVRQGYNDLLHTADGKLWAAGGKLDPYAHDYVFTSETTGIAITDHEILRTEDGGRTYPWPSVSHCSVKVEVQGLTREADCTWSKLSFPTADIGYAVGFISGTQFTILAKTSDGGATWSLRTIDGLTGQGAGDVWFFDPNTAIMRTGDSATGQLYKTTDGGATWKPTAGNRGQKLRFAGSQVGWSFLNNEWHFTVDGGQRWNSRNIAFPATVEAFSLPQPDRGYVVGDHGMVYRYRIVPVDYKVKSMLEAPTMPSNAK